MHIIKPVSLLLVSASEAEDDAPDWSVGTTYAIGDSVIRNGKIYVSSIDSNLGFYPENEVQELEGARWILVGATNIRRWIDGSISEGTTGTSPLVLEAEAGAGFNTIALFELSASYAKVEVYDGTSWRTVGEIYSGALPVNNWWDWRHSEFYPETRRSVIEGAGGLAGHKIRLTIEGGAPEIGEVVGGRVVTVGDTLFSASTATSRRTLTDINQNIFGNTTVTKRAIIRDVSYRVHAKRAGFAAVERFLDSVDGIPVAAFADQNYPSLIGFGFIIDYDLPAELPDDIFFEIILQGVK